MATPTGFAPTGMVATTVLVAVSMTETVARCAMATAKGTPVTSEMTPMYSGVKSLYGTKAGLVVKRRSFDSYGRRIAAVGLARYAGPIPQFFDFRPTENASTRQMC